MVVVVALTLVMVSHCRSPASVAAANAFASIAAAPIAVTTTSARPRISHPVVKIVDHLIQALVLAATIE